MRKLLERICADEEVTVAPAVYPLVIRAGGGSARDSLSVLDQLVAGAGPEGVTYERAVALLGVTDVSLIDDVVDALAAGDRAAVFEAVDRLVEAGHDPRRFATDLLQRLRDLTLLQAVPEAVERGLVEAADDEIARMVEQSGKFGAATLTRYGEILHVGLTEMRGATAPRLLLELLCARMLLPAATTEEPGLLERLERLERRSAIAAGPPAPGESGAGGDLSVSAPPGGGSAQGGAAGRGLRLVGRPTAGGPLLRRPLLRRPPVSRPRGPVACRPRPLSRPSPPPHPPGLPPRLRPPLRPPGLLRARPPLRVPGLLRARPPPRVPGLLRPHPPPRPGLPRAHPPAPRRPLACRPQAPLPPLREEAGHPPRPLRVASPRQTPLRRLLLMVSRLRQPHRPPRLPLVARCPTSGACGRHRPAAPASGCLGPAGEPLPPAPAARPGERRIRRP